MKADPTSPPLVWAAAITDTQAASGLLAGILGRSLDSRARRDAAAALGRLSGAAARPETAGLLQRAAGHRGLSSGTRMLARIVLDEVRGRTRHRLADGRGSPFLTLLCEPDRPWPSPVRELVLVPHLSPVVRTGIRLYPGESLDLTGSLILQQGPRQAPGPRETPVPDIMAMRVGPRLSGMSLERKRVWVPRAGEVLLSTCRFTLPRVPHRTVERMDIPCGWVLIER